MNSDVQELMILKAFKIGCIPANVPLIKQVTWHPHPCYWVKCNTDGAARDAPGLTACGDTFKDHSAATLGCFAVHLGVKFALHAELFGAIFAIEIAFKKGWHNLWLECDSQLVIKAFNSLSIVPWQICHRWKNCLELT